MVKANQNKGGIFSRISRRLSGNRVPSDSQSQREIELALQHLLKEDLYSEWKQLVSSIMASNFSPLDKSALVMDAADYLIATDSSRRSDYLAVLRGVFEREKSELREALLIVYEAIHREEVVDFKRWLDEVVGKANSSFGASLDQGMAPLVEKEVSGQLLEPIRRRLSAYATAHAGLPIEIRATMNGKAWLDGERINLPRIIDCDGDNGDADLYVGLTAILAGYIEFGSADFIFQSEPDPGTCQHQAFYCSFTYPIVAKSLFQVVELARVVSRVHAAYPGLERSSRGSLIHVVNMIVPSPLPSNAYRELLNAALFGHKTDAAGSEYTEEWLESLKPINGPRAQPEATAVSVSSLYPFFEALWIQAESIRQVESDIKTSSDGHNAEVGNRWKSERVLRSALAKKGKRVPLTDLRRISVGSINSGADYREVSEFLERNPGHRGGVTESSDKESLDTRVHLDRGNDVALIERGGSIYPEWDYRIGDYKQLWVRVTEYDVVRKDAQFVDRVLGERGDIIGQVRKKFEALRDDEMSRVKRVRDGDLIDIDAFVQSKLNQRATGHVDDAVYSRLRSRSQNLSVGFLVDLSSSTNEPAGFGARSILDLEKEALIVVCEAIEALGQQSSVWGFSGSGREEVSFYKAKGFEEPWCRSAMDKIGGLSWKMENRDGGAIRHAVSLFQAHKSDTNLLVVLSDGRPLDCGSGEYRDEYGRADTHRALLEAKSAGVNPYCITVDPSGASYLPELYGNVGYTVIEDVRSLPDLIPRIIRQLTR